MAKKKIVVKPKPKLAPTPQGCIYLLRNLVNGKGYVGQFSGRRAEQRWARHFKYAFNGGPQAIHAAIRKYGIANFATIVIWRGSVSKLDTMEIKFIKKLGTFAPGGYNLTLGGKTSRGWVPSKVTRANIAAAKRGTIHTEETRAKMSVSGRGRKMSKEARINMSTAQLGHVVTETTRAKLSVANSGKRKPLTLEHRAAISAKLSGRKITPKWRAKLSAARMGVPPWNKGLKLVNRKKA